MKETSSAIPESGSQSSGLDAGVLKRLLDSDIDLEIQCLETTASTNDLASRHLLSSHPNGCCKLVTADYQYAGRGRRGRKWLSPPSLNLLFSIAIPAASGTQDGFKPDELTSGLFNLAAAVAICEAVEVRSHLHPRIKWPNDVHINGRKLAGVLSEAIVKPGGQGMCGMVVGIGMNANQTKDQLDMEIQGIATSLKIETGKNWDRAELVSAITGRLIQLAYSNDRSDWDAASQGWKQRCDTPGRWVRIRLGDQYYEGTALGLESGGGLTLRLDDGTQRTFSAGEITVVD